MKTHSILSEGPVFPIRCLWQGLTLLMAPRLRRYILAPLLINLVVYSLGFWALGHYFSTLMDWLLPSWLEWLRWLIWPLLAISALVVVFFSFTVIANIIGSPFYGGLASEVRRLQGEVLPQIESNLVWDIVGNLAMEAHRLGYIVLRTLPIIVMFPIPGINLMATILWMVFGAWSMALEYCSYPLEIQGLNFSQQREFLAGRRLEALSFGGMVMLGLTIPVLNILIPPAAVIGATLYCQVRKAAVSPE